MELLKTLKSKCKHLTLPDIIQGITYTKIKITCWGIYAQQPETHFGRDQVLSSIQKLLTAGWNIVKISTTNHTQEEMLNINISMAKYPTPLRITEMSSDRTTRTLYQFHHHDDNMEYTLNSINLGHTKPTASGNRQGYINTKPKVAKQGNTTATEEVSIDGIQHMETDKLINAYGLGDENEFSLPPELFPELSSQDLKQLSLEALPLQDTLFENK